jgi:hypothetical protein
MTMIWESTVSVRFRPTADHTRTTPELQEKREGKKGEEGRRRKQRNIR